MLSSIENGTFSYIGDGESYITVTHPKDVAKCLRLALEKDDEGNAFNVASFSCRIKDMVEKIAESMNIEKPKKHVSYSIAYIAAVFSEMLGILLNKEPKITRFRVKSMGTNRIINEIFIFYLDIIFFFYQMLFLEKFLIHCFVEIKYVFFYFLHVVVLQCKQRHYSLI